MLVKKFFFKLYLNLIYFFLIFFLCIGNKTNAEVLTEGGYKRNVEVYDIDEDIDEDNDSEEPYIKYEDLKPEKSKRNPFNIFGIKKKKKKKIEKEIVKEKAAPYSNKIVIGVLLPLTGKYAHIGQSLLDTMQMVIYENKNIESELIIKDTKANASLAKKATKELVDNNVDIILGPFFSSSLKQSKKIAKYSNIPLISFSNDKKGKEKGIYLMGFEPEKQIKVVTEYTIKKKYRRYAALLPDTKYGRRALNTYRKVLGSNKLSIQKVELYDPKINELEKHIQRLVGLEKNPQIEKDTETGENPIEDFDPGFDSLLLLDTGNNLRQTVALLTYYGVDFKKIKLIGTGQWHEDKIGSEPGLLGAWFVAPNPRLWQNFKKKFYKTYNYEPVRLSSLAHDSLTTILSIKKKNNDLKKIQYSDFQNTFGFTGIDGEFRFRSDGTVERKLSILEITQKNFKIQKQEKKNFF